MLKRIDLDKFEEQIEWLWEKVRAQGYAFDDLMKDNSQAFLLYLFATGSAHWYNEVGMVSLVNIQEGRNANLHFLLWDNYPKEALLEDANQVLTEAFLEFNLSRITATIPSFNKGSSRLAVELGMKYEGSMRECFVHEGRSFDLLIYGLLRREFKGDRTWAASQVPVLN